MKTTTVLFALFAAITLNAAQPEKPATFEVRLVVDSTSPNAEPLTVLQKGTKSGQTLEERVYVEKKSLLDRSALDSANARVNEVTGSPEIQITFTEQGTKRFAAVTREHVGQRLAIVIDGKVYSAPFVKTEIPGGKAVISGSFSQQEATELAARLTTK